MAAIYTLTSILSAFLVFFIQPVAAKLALPTLGGVPAVWNGCMLFFQTMLLLGYLYAHGLSNHVKPRHQPMVHQALLALTLFTFPLAFDGASDIDPAFAPMQWLLTMLFYSLALPFFIISATSPLLQRWFARSNHPDAHNPYFLYAASNVGSMGALLLYPFAIEPFLTLTSQVWWWEAGIGLLFLCFLGVAFYVMRRSVEETSDQHAAQGIGAVTWANRLRWIALAFVPSSLLYGVTAYITTDIASAPLLWILPLTLYLITFIIVFATKPRGIDLMLELHIPIVIVLVALMLFKPFGPLYITMVHLLGFFFITWALHGLLSRSKPAPQHLTEFFLWMSLGGVLGGVANTLIAPYVFETIAEYRLSIILSVLLRCFTWQEARKDFSQKRKSVLAFTTIAALLLFASLSSAIENMLYSMIDALTEDAAVKLIASLSVALIYIVYSRLKTNFAALAFSLFIISFALLQLTEVLDRQDTLLKERSPFGVYEVRSKPDVMLFVHGSTLHGIQVKEEAERLKPKAYYNQLNAVFQSLPESVAMEPMALVGLGAGTVLCYAKEGQEVDGYEIDPLVLEIAQDERYFTYIRDCKGTNKFILGDARLNLLKQPDDRYGMIVMDAFSSDAIPAHLTTVEAVEGYLTKLQPEGVIAFNVSNRHLNLIYMLSAVGQKLGLTVGYKYYWVKEEEKHLLSSAWLAMSRDPAYIERLKAIGGWHSAPQVPEKYVWTDDFSNIILSHHNVVEWLDDLPKLTKDE